MAHLQKFTQADYPKLLMHYGRAKDANGEYHKFRNQDIDLTRTDQNYNVAAGFQTLPQSEFMDKRLSQLKIFNRPDVKYLCDWVVTLPKGMGPEEHRFFDAVFKFLSDKYGLKNVVSAYVHKDEKQPHMHFAFIPVAMDKKKNVEKLCSKDIVGRDDLSVFHEELDAYLKGVFGRDTGVRNGATVLGNKSIEELKRGTAIKTLKDAQERLDASEKLIDGLNCPKSIDPVKVKKDVVIVTKEDFDNMNHGLAKIQMSDDLKKDADARVAAVDHEQQVKYGQLWKMYNEKTAEIKKLKTERADMKSEMNGLQGKIQHTNKVFNFSPGLLDTFLWYAERMEKAEAEAEQAELAAKAALRKSKQHQKQAEMG